MASANVGDFFQAKKGKKESNEGIEPKKGKDISN